MSQMLQWFNKHILDLHHSEWNEKNSDPKKGQYDFKNKVYVNYYDKGRRPAWYFTWIRNVPQRLSEARIDGGYEPVVVGDKTCMYWPEGLIPDAEGHYIDGDLIFCRCPLIRHLQKMQAQKELSERRGFRDTAKRFAAEARNEGADIREDEIEKLAKQFLS